MSTEETPALGPKSWVSPDQLEGLRKHEALGHTLRNIAVFLPCQAEHCSGSIYADGKAVMRGSHPDLCMKCEAGEGPVESPAMKEWKGACPARFRSGDHKTRIDHPEFPRAAYDGLKAALPASGNLDRNILLVGDTGGGKSRMLWLAAYELMVRRKVPTRCLRGTDFREQLVGAYRDEDADPEAYLAGLKAAPLLIWDDFGQDTLRAGTLSDLRAVIDARYNEGRPTFITTNYPEADLVRRLVSNAGGDSGQGAVAASIARRLWEDAAVIKV